MPRFSAKTRHKLRVLLEELEAAANSNNTSLGGSAESYALQDWNLTARYLAPEVLLHLKAKVKDGERREVPTWLTVTEKPEIFDASPSTVEALTQDPNPSVRDALGVLRSHINDYQGERRAQFQRALAQIVKVVEG